MNNHCSWPVLVNRRLLEDGLTKVFSYESGGGTHYAVGQHLALPDADWLRIDLTHSLSSAVEYRFDCLRMMQAATHTGLDVERDDNTVLIKLTTRHRGLVNLVFVIREALPLKNPFLV